MFTPWKDAVFVALDTETTHLDPEPLGEVIEIAARPFDPLANEQGELFHVLMKPEHIDTAQGPSGTGRHQGALEANGYDPALWNEEATTKYDGVVDFDRWLGQLRGPEHNPIFLVGSHIAYDAKHLHAMADATGHRMQNLPEAYDRPHHQLVDIQQVAPTWASLFGVDLDSVGTEYLRERLLGPEWVPDLPVGPRTGAHSAPYDIAVVIELACLFWRSFDAAKVRVRR